jgi:phospholipid/cholesterol/gamma-HCH transport system substrate-binding protein
MYASRTTQFIVGLFALVGIAALAFLSLRLGRVELFPAPGYTLYANFDSVAGLKPGDQVEIAGVKIGKVQNITLQNDLAHASLRINQGVDIDTEAFASIKSSGIIGDKFVSIALGPGERMLHDQGFIRHTQSSVVLEDLIGQFISNASPNSSSSATASGGSGTNLDGGAGASPNASPGAGANGGSATPAGHSTK